VLRHRSPFSTASASAAQDYLAEFRFWFHRRTSRARRLLFFRLLDILNQQDAVGEIPSDDVIADAQLAATSAPTLGGAQIALMNPGGVRGGPTFGFLFAPSGIEEAGEVTDGEAFTVHPFGNSLVTKTMTGPDPRPPRTAIRRLLPDEQPHPADLGGVHVCPARRRTGVRRQGQRPPAQWHADRSHGDLPGDDEQLPRLRW
jgi:hypothetical protein